MIQVKSNSSSIPWTINGRYRVGQSVTSGTQTYINFTGKNSDPSLLTDWYESKGTGSGSGGPVPVGSWTVYNTNFGKYGHNDVVPAAVSQHEQIKEAFQVVTQPTWTNPTISLTANEAVNQEREVGETLNFTFGNSYTANDGGVLNSVVYKKNNTPLNDGNQNDTDTIILSETPVSYIVTGSYAAGSGTKPTNPPTTPVPNPIAAGDVDSSPRSYRGYNPVFFGSTAANNTTGTAVRSNLTKRLTNDGNVWNLDSGIVHNIFEFWLHEDETLVSVIDLDASNANITSDYLAVSFQVPDANGTLMNGTLYRKIQSVPYTVNHRHQITKS